MFKWADEVDTKEVSDEIDFLRAEKHETLLQIDMTLIGIAKHSQNSKVTMSLQYITKEVRKGVHF